MEGAMLLLLFSAFLVVIIYKMDVNEKNLYEAGFMDGVRQGMNWGISREEALQKFGEIMKRNK